MSATPTPPKRPRELEVRDLTITIRRDGSALEAVSGVNLTLKAGQSIGLVGESGSGKSLLARAVMGLVPGYIEVTGTVAIDGEEVPLSGRNGRENLWGAVFSMVFQDPMTALSPVKRIGSQLEGPIRHHSGLNRTEARQRAVELLQHVGIPDPTRRLRQYPHELSGGMRQRVVIALALAGRPSFLFADEPTTALDVTVQAQVLNLLDDLRQNEEMALLLCSHDLGVVGGRTSEVIVMYAGQVVEHAPTNDIFSSPRMPYTEALLRSIPRIDQPTHSRLKAIGGRPPALGSRPDGCRFAPRCELATDKCQSEMPPLIDADDGHWYRCWYPRNMESRVDPGAANQDMGVVS